MDPLKKGTLKPREVIWLNLQSWYVADASVWWLTPMPGFFSSPILWGSAGWHWRYLPIRLAWTLTNQRPLAISNRCDSPGCWLPTEVMFRWSPKVRGSLSTIPSLQAWSSRKLVTSFYVQHLSDFIQVLLKKKSLHGQLHFIYISK